FIRQCAPEFNQRAPVIQTVAIEKPVQAALEPLPERFENRRRNYDCKNPAPLSIRLRVKNETDQSDESEENNEYALGCSRVCKAAIEDDAHVHQAVTDNRITEAKRNQDQAEHRKLHPRREAPTEYERKDIKQCAGQTSNKRPAHEPFQLLPQHSGGRILVA